MTYYGTYNKESINKNFKMIGDKENLIITLRSYKKILSKAMYDYLESLIELEFSIVREYISNEDKNHLSELSIYKKIEIYNIMNRAINIFNKDKHTFFLEENGPYERSIFYRSSNGIVKEIFCYKNPKKNKENTYYGIILFQNKNDKKTLNNIYKIYAKDLKDIMQVENPYLNFGDLDFIVKNWDEDHNKLINSYNMVLNRLIEFKENDYQKEDKKIINKICREFINDYELDIKDIQNKEYYQSSNNFEKSLIYKKGNTNITLKQETYF